MATETETNVTRTRHLDATRMSRGITQEKSIGITQVRNLDVTANPAALGPTAFGLKTDSRSRHRIGASEDESAFVSRPSVSEVAGIGKPDPAVKREVIKAFFVLTEGYTEDAHLAEALKEHVRHEVGPVAVVGEIVFTSMLPKTCSGKVMRRVLKRETGALTKEMRLRSWNDQDFSCRLSFSLHCIQVGVRIEVTNRPGKTEAAQNRERKELLKCDAKGGTYDSEAR